MLGNIRDLLDNIENMIFQMLSWLVLVPKELFAIVASPSLVPERIQHALNRSNDDDPGTSPFDKGLSPIFLYLIVAVLPYWALEQIEVKLNLHGPSSVTVEEHYELGFDTSELKPYAGESIRVVLRQNGAIIDARDEQAFLGFGTLTVPVTAERPGVARFDLVAKVNGTQVSDDKWLVEVRAKETLTSSNTSDAKHRETTGTVVREELSQDLAPAIDVTLGDEIDQLGDHTATPNDLVAYVKSDRFVYTAIGLLVVPLLLAIVMLVHARKPMTQSNLRPIFYVQCAFFSPMVIGVYIAAGMSSLLPHEPLLIGLAWWVFAITALWFAITQVNYIAESLSIRYRDAIGVVSQYLFALLMAALTFQQFSSDTEQLGYVRAAGIVMAVFILGAALTWIARAIHRALPGPSARLGKALLAGLGLVRRFYGGYLYLILFIVWLVGLEALIGKVDTDADKTILGLFIVATVLAGIHNTIVRVTKWLWRRIRPVSSPDESGQQPANPGEHQAKD